MAPWTAAATLAVDVTQYYYYVFIIMLLQLLLFMSASAEAAGSSSSSNNSPAIFIFGDSLADVGNNNYLAFTTLKSNFYPYGVDYPGRVPTGRFTNGLVVLDILANNLGFPISSPYLSPNSKGLALLQGVNYASGGCGILNETTNNSTGCLSMSTQLKYHENTVHRIFGQLGADVTESFLNKSLYFVIIGSNDFLGNYIRNTTRDSRLYSPSQFVSLLMSTLSTQISRLYMQNARKIVLVGLGPLGCIPYIRARTNNGSCNQELNNWATMFNIGLQELVRELSSTYPDAMVTFVNPYPILQDLIENSPQKGFTVINEACCGAGRLNSQIPCLPLFSYCSNRTNHVFWDPWHPTEATNKLLANAFLSEEKNNIVGPWSIMQLASSNN